VWLSLASASFGQTFYGSIVGSVNDATSGAVPQANVTLTNLGTAERRSMQTDSSGNYQFVNLVPGHYRVEIQKTGFKRLTREDLLSYPLVAISQGGEEEGAVSGFIVERGLARQSEMFNRDALNVAFADKDEAPRMRMSVAHSLAMPA